MVQFEPDTTECTCGHQHWQHNAMGDCRVGIPNPKRTEYPFMMFCKCKGFTEK